LSLALQNRDSRRCLAVRTKLIMKWTWDKFGFHVSRLPSDPFPMERDPQLILECLKLMNTAGVRVYFHDSLGRAMVTVESPAISVSLEDTRRASRQSGWDVEVYTVGGLGEARRNALRGFASIDNISLELARSLVDHGYLGFEDLSVIDPDFLKHMGRLDAETVDAIIEQAEIRSEEAES